ncbi:hypothetical protein CNYM01_08367 [Colletotrichum nymphaeae SA-01]|uniref:Uncharacterized protein n=1 Tax=Colletotrichum nymphaeae SA-01 TaxID=1460502 RepID=A0A135SM10_9PEZI|nr:hypothetical protein CNYM01_08367 [Colletotrichum nymphaeae SA-01]
MFPSLPVAKEETSPLATFLNPLSLLVMLPSPLAAKVIASLLGAFLRPSLP